MEDLLETASRCPHCRASVRPGAPWCTLCHADLRPEPSPVAEAPVVAVAPVVRPLDPLTAPLHLAYLHAFAAICVWLADRGLAHRMAK